MGLQRFNSELITAAVDTSGNIANCEVIPMGSYAGGGIIVPAGSSVNALAPYGCHTADGTYVPIYDSSNTAVSRTVAGGRAYALPDECFGFRFIKLVANAAGSILLNLKS